MHARPDRERFTIKTQDRSMGDPWITQHGSETRATTLYECHQEIWVCRCRQLMGAARVVELPSNRRLHGSSCLVVCPPCG